MEENLVEMLGKMWVALQKIEKCKEFVPLIPEVRTNIVYAKQNPRGPEDVLAIDGRITIVDNMPHAAGKPRFGVSSHMARLIIELNKIDPSIRSGINITYNPQLAEWLRGYCRDKGWVLSVVDRTKEPDEAREKEGESIPWKVKEAISVAGGKPPKILCEINAVGKEDLVVVVGSDPVEVAEETCKIARLYSQDTQPRPRVGKIDVDTFKSFVLQRLGKKDMSVVVPPLTGVDAAVIEIANNKVLIVAEDPIFSIPKLPLEMFGWYAVHIGASDVAVMGVKPRYMTYTLLMPPQTKENDFEAIIDSIHRAAVELDIAIVGGHTGYYPGFAAPTIGGITVFAIADKNAYVTPANAKPGDRNHRDTLCFIRKGIT